MSGLAGLGSFAGGLAGGIREGDRLVSTKLARQDVTQRMDERKKSISQGEQFNIALKGLMSGDEATIDAVRGMFGQKAKTITPGGTGQMVPSAVAPGRMTMQNDMPAAPESPYSGAGLGSE